MFSPLRFLVATCTSLCLKSQGVAYFRKENVLVYDSGNSRQMCKNRYFTDDNFILETDHSRVLVPSSKISVQQTAFCYSNEPYNFPITN